jgi:osmotically-inducible protein OsmY
MLGNKTDAQIKDHVIRELKWDTRVDENEIGVEVKQGVVSLTGYVTSWGKKVGAADAAHRVHGVLDVANDIKVRFPGSPERTDADVAKAVRQALEWDVFVPQKRIQSTVSDGLVTLKGTVDFYGQKQDAEHAIRNLEGVRGVINEIEVLFEANAEKVRRSIEEALGRYAIHEAKGIAATVKDGEVTLTGKVKSWAERRAIVGAAYGTAGVRRVEDRMRMDGD